MKYLEIEKDNLYLCFGLPKEDEARLLKIAAKKGSWQPKAQNEQSSMRIVELQKPDEKNVSFRGAKNFYDVPQVSLKYISHVWNSTEYGDRLVILQEGDGLQVQTFYQFYSGLPVFSCESEVTNCGEQEIWLDSVTSFSYGNIDSYQSETTNPADDLEIYYAHNTWSAECRWVKKSLQECGVLPYGNLCYDRFRIENHSGFSSGEFLPEGAIYNQRTDESILWQIEHNGSWAWEIGCVIGDYRQSFLEKKYSQQICLQLFGPQMEGSMWQKKLSPGESFLTVPVVLTVSAGNPEEAFVPLTHYRRRRKQVTELPVIFNDYMNCMMGDSTTQSLRPYIHKAAAAGCEIFVVDCGWYDVGDWQYTFGTFEECKTRYPNGLKEVMDEIRLAGMNPGLWLELESIGIENPDADTLPSDWLFCRHGKPVVDSGRYHFDFRNPKVRAHASAIVKKVIDRYDLAYLKIDYNLCLCWGTDRDSDSLGDGLLEHNRAYLKWLEEEMKKYPQVIWENCGSGGLRMDYAMLSRMDIQSVSDQEDYRLMAHIAANCATAVLPEQAGIWSYPRREGDCLEVIVNMVSAMLFRIHLGGHLKELSPERFLLVKEGIKYYKKIRNEIPHATPYWPLKLHSFNSELLCWGIHTGQTDYIAVTYLGSAPKELRIPAQRPLQKVQIGYPHESDIEIIDTDTKTQQIVLRLPGVNTACIIEIH